VESDSSYGNDMRHIIIQVVGGILAGFKCPECSTDVTVPSSEKKIKRAELTCTCGQEIWVTSLPRKARP